MNILLILFILFIIILTGCDISNRQVDEFCVNQGFNKSSDYKYVDKGFVNNGMHIECDNKQIFFNVPCHDICVDRNKWMECNEKKYICNYYEDD